MSEYWDEHKDELNRKRRLKYRTDAAYREKAIERSTETIDKKRRKRIEAQLQGLEFDSSRGREFVIKNGQVVELYPVSAIAKYVNVTVTTVRSWLRDGIFPEATMMVGVYRRFSIQYAEMVRSVVVLLGTTRLRDKSFKGDIAGTVSKQYALIEESEKLIRDSINET